MSPLPETIVDSATTVHAIGCALGLDVPLLRLVARALGGEDAERPTVYSSKLWAAFAPDPSRTAGVSRYLADGWIVCVHPDADADKRKIARLFRARYPNDAVDWEDALTRPSPRFLGDTYSRTARGDFHFKSVFSSRELSPRLAHRSGQIAWLTGHTSLLAELAARGLDWKSHYWDVHPGIHVTPEGTRLPALVADGVCRVIIVSRVRTAPNPNDPDAVVPLRPPLTDERFYTAAH